MPSRIAFGLESDTTVAVLMMPSNKPMQRSAVRADADRPNRKPDQLNSKSCSQMISQLFDPSKFGWYGQIALQPLSFRCGYCDDQVSSVAGYKLGFNRDGSGHQLGGIYLCPSCLRPTFLSPSGVRLPDVSFGSSVGHVPTELGTLYDEARRCTSNSCYTASVLLCRKILMHIGVEQGADEGKNFIHYVNYLADRGFVPPNGKHWVDHIRKKSNEANHEICLMERGDASDLIHFIEMLLKFIYEFPSMIPVQKDEQG